MQKSFSFKGMTCNSDNMLVADGECMELLNLRYKDGCLLPIPSTFKDLELESAYDKIYWHSVAKRYLCIEMGMTGSVHFYDENFNILTNPKDNSIELFPTLQYVERIEFSGNIVCCIAKDTSYYLIYDSDNYRFLGERPYLPDLTFTIKTMSHSVVSEDAYETGVTYRRDSEYLRWDNVSKGYFDECFSVLHGKGYYVDSALFRYALRMFDGSYLYYSPVYYVQDPQSVLEENMRECNLTSEPIKGPNTCSQYRATVRGFMPTFHFSNLNLSAWKDIVVGIDIFTTGSIYMSKVVDNTNNTRTSSLLIEKYSPKNPREMWNDVIDASLFYKVAEYSPLGDLVDSVKDVSPSSLATSVSLPDDMCSQVCRSAMYSYLYNGRLHLAGMREKFFKGYGTHSYLPATMGAERADYVTIVTKIKTAKGISVVKKDFEGEFAIGVSNGVYYLTPYIMYPDSRAYEMTFIITVKGVTYKKVFTLKKHKTLNIALYLHAYTDGSTVSIDGELQSGSVVKVLYPEGVKAFFSYIPGMYSVRFNAADGFWYFEGRKLVLGGDENAECPRMLLSARGATDGEKVVVVIEEGEDLSDIVNINNIKIDLTWDILDDFETIEEENAVEVRGNVMKVSATDNPFYFPAENTYSPSSDDIVAVCSNTIALSQGQFGQHPLYVFCKDGIWAMSCDGSGKVAYTTAHPVSREVCLSPSSLCATDSGVVFLAKNGLMLLHGSSISSLSEAIDSDTVFPGKMTMGDIFYKISFLPYLHSSVSSVPFKEYVGGAVVGYLAEENELWVSNYTHDYTYVYSLKSGAWSKINRSFTGFVNKYPYMVGITTIDDKSYISKYGREHVKPYVPILLFTRPQLCGVSLPKRIFELRLYATLKMATECEPYEFNGVGCYLLCSNDGKNYTLVSGCEKKKDCNDILFPFSTPLSYKYFIIAVSGTISLDSRLVGVDLHYETAWNNRLR